MATSRTIELTVLSAENLRSSNNRKPFNKPSFVSVRTDLPVCKTHVTAETDSDGGGGPRWNEKMEVEIPPQARSLIVEVQCRKSGRVIGAASIPVTEFTGGCVPETYLHFLSYTLRDERGVRSGVVNVSVRTKVASSSNAAEAYGRKVATSGCGSASTSSAGQAKMGYPAVDNSAVVTGVPVNWKSYSKVQY